MALREMIADYISTNLTSEEDYVAFLVKTKHVTKASYAVTNHQLVAVLRTLNQIIKEHDKDKESRRAGGK